MEIDLSIMSSVNAETYKERSKCGSYSASVLKVQSGQRLDFLKIRFRGSPPDFVSRRSIKTT